MHTIPSIIVFMQIVSIPEPDSLPVHVTNHGNHIFSVSVSLGFAESKIALHRLLLAATRFGLPDVESYQITVYGIQNIIKLHHHNAWYTWLWR